MNTMNFAPPSLSPSSSLASMAAALSSLPSMSMIEPQLLRHTASDSSSDENDIMPSCQLPRFRQDKVLDHLDVERQMGDLRTALQRSLSSGSIAMPPLEEANLSFSESFVASQQQILEQIQNGSASNSQSSIQLPPSERRSPPLSPSSGNRSFREELKVGLQAKKKQQREKCTEDLSAVYTRWLQVVESTQC